MYLDYNCVCSGIRLECEKLRIGIAADNGELYSFMFKGASAKRDANEKAISEDEARKAIPSDLRAKCEGLMYAETVGGNEKLCYDFACENRDDSLHILVDALTGKQFRIIF
mgnify:CR=1 FL=1